MPIYEYKCDLCNGLWEEIQKFSDDPLTLCKSCEKEGGVPIDKNLLIEEYNSNEKLYLTKNEM